MENIPVHLSDLNDEELKLIFNYRNLDEEEQKQLLNASKGTAERAAAKSEN